jgi:glycosyltransferase involved in cell wall biosynthesis
MKADPQHLTISRVLGQNLEAESYEIIVVNDSGKPLEGFECLQSTQVTVVNTNRAKLCMARNVGAAVATGKYLYFLDDDDYLLPGRSVLC